MPKDLDFESRIDALDPAALESDYRPGKISVFTCPECSGPLWELHDGDLLRFRCRVGHAYTGDTMMSGKSEALEDALWVALNTLQESAQIAEHLGADARERNHTHVARRFDEKVRLNMQRIGLIREALMRGNEDVPGNTNTGDEDVADEDSRSSLGTLSPGAQSPA